MTVVDNKNNEKGDGPYLSFLVSMTIGNSSKRTLHSICILSVDVCLLHPH